MVTDTDPSVLSLIGCAGPEHAINADRVAPAVAEELVRTFLGQDPIQLLPDLLVDSRQYRRRRPCLEKGSWQHAMGPDTPSSEK